MTIFGFNKKIVYSLAFAVIFIGGGLFYYSNQLFANIALEKENTSKVGSGKKYIVELRESGFYPEEITIQTGERVTFATKTGKNFWPASDPHPIHDYLPGFDPGKPIASDESWSYTLNKPGSWRYHDHLNVSFRGEITVLNIDGSEFLNQVDLGEYCDGECFDGLIRDMVKKGGIDAAYELFTKTYEEDKLSRSCHWTAHQIGEEAYELFREGKEFPITYATSYCGYGFYHGFMEGLLREDPDTDYALSFCDRVESQLGKLGLWNCYHGIGHGFTEDPPDPRVWGNFEEIIAPGIEMCEFLFGDTFGDLNLCLTGVFTVPAGFAEHEEFGLSLDPEDPFAFCKSQPYRYHKACYGEFAPKLAVLIGSDLYKLPKYTEEITDAKTLRLVVWVVPSVMMARDIMNDNFSSYIYGCRNNFSGRLQDICLGGTILGFFSHGEPEKQYEKLLEFCAADIFLGEERELCYGESFRHMRQRYSVEKVEQICNIVPQSYRRHCLEIHHEPPYDDPSFDEPPEEHPSFGQNAIIFLERNITE